MKKSLILLASSLVLATSAQAEVEFFYTHNLAHKNEGTALEYMPQGDDYGAEMNLSPTQPDVMHATTVYTMPADPAGWNLLFNVKDGYNVEHLFLQMGDHEYSDQQDGGPDVDSFVIFTGYDIDGVHTERQDTLWNGRNSSMIDHPRYTTVYLRNVNAKKDVRLYFDCSHSARITNPQPDIYTGETKAQGYVCMNINTHYDLKPACYELVTSQDQIKPYEHYMLTAQYGEKSYGLSTDTLVKNNPYLKGKELPINAEGTTYDGAVSVEFQTTPDSSGFAPAEDCYFLELPAHYGTSRYSLRTNSLGFYLSEYGQSFYLETEFKLDENKKPKYIPIDRFLYTDLWKITYNDNDGSVSLVSVESVTSGIGTGNETKTYNQEGRELQYNPQENYFVYQKSGKYEPKLYLWHRTGPSQSIRAIEANDNDAAAPCYDLQGRRLRSDNHAGLYIQNGHLQFR